MERMRRAFPYAVVFITSMSIMIIELVASRLVAKYFGNSLFTWTGIIGTVLGGISLGNYLGGRLADRYPADRLASVLLLATSVLVFLILILDQLLEGFWRGGGYDTVTAGVVARSVGAIFLLFFLPSASLGTISPVMATYALERGRGTGRTVGSVYAVSSIGSIIGTFLAGYLLIPLLGVSMIIYLIAGTLAVIALGMGLRVLSAAWLSAVCLIFFFAGNVSPFPGTGAQAYEGPLGERILYAAHSKYAHISVREEERRGTRIRTLVMDGLVHNMYDPGRPDELLYDYEKLFAALTRELVGPSGRAAVRTLTLGGGACLFPSYLRLRHPGFHEVVELDPRVIDVARRYFDLRTGPDLRVYAADARSYVNNVMGEKTYHLVYLDAFNSFSVPSHLTTREFTEQVRSLLEPDGWFMANCVDIYTEGRFLTAYVNTVGNVFQEVAVYTDASGAGSTRTTFLRARNGEGYLTDDRAPVENLMAPVFLSTIE